MFAERRIFFLGALPGRPGRLPPFLRPYVRPSVPRLGAPPGVTTPGAATKWIPKNKIILEKWFEN